MNVLSAPSAIATATAATADKSSASGLASDFETFLKMLTAQARYQDPLEPIDLTEYASQLAQFSMVEQQVKTNDMLSALSGQFGHQVHVAEVGAPSIPSFHPLLPFYKLE